MSLKAVSVYVKEETKECDGTGECVRVKEENECAEKESTLMHVKIEREWEWSDNEVCVPVKKEIEEYPQIKEEKAWEADLTPVWAEHEVKRELVLSPEGLQPQDIAFSLRDKTNALIHRTVETGKQDPQGCHRVEENPHSSRDSEELLVLRPHTVRDKHNSIDKKQNTSIKKSSLSLDHAWKTKLKTHKDDHEKGPFVCDFCQNQFVKKKNLALHIRIHMGMKQYFCNTCKKQYTNSYNLKRHRLIHMEKKPYSCGLCPRQFVELRNLNNHIRGHTGEKPFVCDICSKKFTQSYNLSSHRKTHISPLELESVVCKVCNKELKNKRSLSAHVKGHSGDKRFSCEICKMQFTKMSNLRRHNRVHTGEKPYSCDLCTKRYADLRDLTKHKLTHTKKTQ